MISRKDDNGSFLGAILKKLQNGRGENGYTDVLFMNSIDYTLENSFVL